MNKKLKALLIIVVALAVVAIAIRIFSGEDTWECKKGKWVKHGNPSSPMPNLQCLK